MYLILKRSKMNQVELSYYLGVHYQFISNIKRGLCGFPVSMAAKLIPKYGSIVEFHTAAVEDFKAAWHEEYDKIKQHRKNK